MIEWADFAKLDICIGTITNAIPNHKARKPSYILEIDFGPLGQKISSAQITENYDHQALVGQQVACVMNFPPKRVAGIKSEVLVLACVCHTFGTVLLSPTTSVEKGVKVA